MSWMTLVGQHAIAILTVLLLALGPSLLAMWFIVRQRRLARQARRSPLTKDLLRTPGHTLREELEELRIDVTLDVLLLMVVPAFVIAALYATQLATGNVASVEVMVLALVGMAVFCFRQIRRLHKKSTQLDQLRLGLDAELAAGQELDQLMRQGAVVFHDLPAEKFNIDHVVIAPQGVFAVETKGYRKPNELERQGRRHRGLRRPRFEVPRLVGHEGSRAGAAPGQVAGCRWGAWCTKWSSAAGM